MKTQSLSLASSHNDHGLEAYVAKEDFKGKELSRKKAIHYAKRNCPQSTGDSLLPYIGDIKSFYDAVVAHVLLYLQPDAHTPEAKLEIEFAKEKDKNLETEITKLERQNHNEEFEMDPASHGHIVARTWTILILTFVIFIGDTIFNTKALQIIGETLLLSLILSVTISFANFLATHVLPLVYKRADTRLKRRLILAGTFAGATVVFIGLAVLRSTYLALQNIYIKPEYFVVINLFLFTISYLLSLYFFPTVEELQEYWAVRKRLLNIEKRNKEIATMKEERAKLRVELLNKSKHYMKSSMYANYLLNRIEKMRHEAFDTFKSTNLTYRTDNQTPDCFYGNVADPEVQFHKISK